MLSAKAAIQPSSVRRVLSLTLHAHPLTHPSMGTLQVQMCPPQTPLCRAQGWHPLSSCKSHTHLLSPHRRAAFCFIPDRYSCNFLGRSLRSSEERPVQALLRNTLGPAATTYIVDIYLKDLFIFLMLFPMLKECCLQCKAKCF